MRDEPEIVEFFVDGPFISDVLFAGINVSLFAEISHRGQTVVRESDVEQCARRRCGELGYRHVVRLGRKREPVPLSVFVGISRAHLRRVVIGISHIRRGVLSRILLVLLSHSEYSARMVRIDVHVRLVVNDVFSVDYRLPDRLELVRSDGIHPRIGVWENKMYILKNHGIVIRRARNYRSLSAVARDHAFAPEIIAVCPRGVKRGVCRGIRRLRVSFKHRAAVILDARLFFFARCRENRDENGQNNDRKNNQKSSRSHIQSLTQ